MYAMHTKINTHMKIFFKLLFIAKNNTYNDNVCSTQPPVICFMYRSQPVTHNTKKKNKIKQTNPISKKR